MSIRRAFSVVLTRFTHRGRAIGEFLRSMPDPILVYQMSKVGSTAVHKALLDAGLPAVHVHFMSEEFQKRDHYLHRNGSLPPHLYVGRMLRPWLKWTKRRVRVVTLVRDPIARYVSGAFHLAHLTGFPTDDARQAIERIQRGLEKGAVTYPAQWFEYELKSILGIDIFDYPFHKEAGYARITTPRVDLLVLTAEQLDQTIPTVLSEFVGRKLETNRARTRDTRVYNEVKHILELSPPIVRRIYNQKLVLHCYNDEQIAGFVERWSALSHPKAQDQL